MLGISVYAESSMLVIFNLLSRVFRPKLRCFGSLTTPIKTNLLAGQIMPSQANVKHSVADH